MISPVYGQPNGLLASEVGAEPVQVLPDVGSARIDAVIQNRGPSPVRIGSATVSWGDPKTGVELASGESLTWPIGGALWAVCQEGQTATLSGFDVR